MSEATIQYETNVDDMDPRLWPNVLECLLDVGAHDAWVTPIIMKKGRPAFTLSVLCGDDVAADVRAVIFRETTTIGIRELVVRRHVLDRSEHVVDVDGQAIHVKAAMFEGDEVNRSVEWDDVVAVAAVLNMSAKAVLAAATAAAQRHPEPG